MNRTFPSILWPCILFRFSAPCHAHFVATARVLSSSPLHMVLLPSLQVVFASLHVLTDAISNKLEGYPQVPNWPGTRPTEKRNYFSFRSLRRIPDSSVLLIAQGICFGSQEGRNVYFLKKFGCSWPLSTQGRRRSSAFVFCVFISFSCLPG